MKFIITLLRTIAPTLLLIQAIFKGLDANEEGIDDKIGGALENVNKAIAALLEAFPTEKPQVRGYEAIRAYCLNTLATIDLTIADPSILAAKKVEIVKELIDKLNDPKIVYQAKRGLDGKFLVSSKLEAARRFEVVIRLND